VIGQVLSISEEEQQQGGDQQGDQGGQQQGGDQGQQGGGQQQQPQTEPQSIEKGMTTDQVEGAMGKPEKIVNLGPKKIYVYKDLKVTFLNGKVFDVQ
jgi:cell division protein FtsN